VAALRREWHGSRERERLSQASQHHEVCMKRNLLDPPHAKWAEAEELAASVGRAG
jgi:hypothetical protein